MIDESIKSNYLTQFDGLAGIVALSRERVIGAEPDPLFYDNQNVFIKSYFVSACSILESFIHEVAIAYVNSIKSRMRSARIPVNIVHWCYGNIKSELKFDNLDFIKTNSDVRDLFSPNYGKTVAAFKKLGVDVQTPAVEIYKDQVSRHVEKRNRIVHHNDMASDISFQDLLDMIEEFSQYCVSIFEAVRQNMFVEG